MFDRLLPLLPRDALNIALLLALAFFIGLEREEHKQREPGRAFGGVRTFPLTGLVSYGLALLSVESLTPWVVGFVVVAGFLLLGYRHELLDARAPGLSGELSALAIYVVGGLIHRQYYWIATTVAVLSVLLLELKKGLEGLTRYFSSAEIITVAKFLVLSVVILPIVPDRDFTRFALNPFKTWIVVVTVSGVSFGSYVLQRLMRERGGVLLAAILGGAYSSTVTTVVMSRQARQAGRPNLFAGVILTASGVMYARLLLLLAIFNRQLFEELLAALALLGLSGVLSGVLVARRPDAQHSKPAQPNVHANPLELRAAFLFAAVFVTSVVLTHLALAYLGRTGMYTLSVVMGVTDVDPFILGLAQMAGGALPAGAGRAILIAAASNNVAKAMYAYTLADRETGRRSLLLLCGLALLGLAPLAFI